MVRLFAASCQARGSARAETRTGGRPDSCPGERSDLHAVQLGRPIFATVVMTSPAAAYATCAP